MQIDSKYLFIFISNSYFLLQFKFWIKMYIAHSIGRQHFFHPLIIHSALINIESLKRVLHAAQRDRFYYSFQFLWLWAPVVSDTVSSQKKTKISSDVVRTREIKVFVSVKFWQSNNESGGVAASLEQSFQTLFWMNPIISVNFLSNSLESSF